MYVFMEDIDAVLGPFAKLRKATISFGMSVRPSARNNSAPDGRINMKFGLCEFFENLLSQFKFCLNRTRIKGILHEDRYIFLSYLAQCFLG
jgi:hypothetical protein